VRLSRRGVSTVEYLLLMCMMVTITCITGYFLKNYAGELVDKVTDRILDAVFILAL
jgi:hypothetical protein